MHDQSSDISQFIASVNSFLLSFKGIGILKNINKTVCNNINKADCDIWLWDFDTIQLPRKKY